MKKNVLTLLTTFVLLFFSNVLFSQVITLGTAANFELFSTVGAIGNTGISQVTGDVGTNSGAVGGFGNVNGIMQSPPNTATGVAAADLLIAYGQLHDATPTFFPAPALGNGDTLIAGVYHIDGLTSLNGTLYLDAKNNGNAVFIFQVEAAFSTGSGAKVKLINGAQACNVYWKIEGVVILSDNTSFKGNIVSHNARIDLNTNDTLEGRALAFGGAINTLNVLAYIPTGCGAIVPVGPAAPNLGAAGCYAIFSSDGFVTNDGFNTTFVTGDIGTNAGGITSGFNPLLVTGMIHDIPDGSTTTCKNALLIAYSYLNLLPFNIELKYPEQLGHNLVLTPHTYYMDAAATLTDTLFLNALGNPDAVFVLQIHGALTTYPFAKVALINGAQSKNVFWKVEGAISIADHSIINGTLISNNGAIDLAIGDSINGRVLTTTGLLTTASVIVRIPDGTCGAVVPLTWLSFSAAKNNSSVLIQWSTANEMNNHHFEIQRSADGLAFTNIGAVPAGNNAGSVQNYSFTDHHSLSGTNFYRLKQIDRDGNFKYSAIVHVIMSSFAWSVFPNPATTHTTVQVSAQMDNAAVRLVDNSGKTVYYRSVKKLDPGEIVDIPLSNCAKGIYMLRITSDTESRTERIVVQ
jgi:hypothetical protein